LVLLEESGNTIPFAVMSPLITARHEIRFVQCIAQKARPDIVPQVRYFFSSILQVLIPNK
jgi:hypothetical protein